ncbi:unnamed protein product [Soboliphyme baturini]|uniref:Exocyst complex component Sec8 n=1 Tax=Soboliphyme baturini TaxID=241478 RepID=A0A183IK25_9BILA|nr:unnamed protein product [Soboliphyme baturini]
MVRAEESSISTVCATIEDYYNDHKHLKSAILNSLLVKLQIIIGREYLKAFESRRLNFHNYGERLTAAEQLKQEADMLKNLFQRLMNKNADEVEASYIEYVSSILIAASDILSLRDKSLLALEVSSFVQKFPEVKVDQLTGIILCREDIGRSDGRQLAQDIISQNRFRETKDNEFSVVFHT